MKRIRPGDTSQSEGAKETGLMRKLILGIGALATLGLVDGASAVPGKPCNNMSDACLIEVAGTYMDGQAGGSGTREAMRLAPTAIRWENAVVAGATGEEIRMRSPAGLNLDIWSQRDRDRVWVDGNEVFSIWIVDIKDRATGNYVITAHIFERFLVEKGPVCGDGLSPCVTEIEAIWCRTPVGFEPATPDPSAPRRPIGCDRGDTPR